MTLNLKIQTALVPGPSPGGRGEKIALTLRLSRRQGRWRRSLGLWREFGLGLIRKVVLAGDDLAARFVKLATCATRHRPAFLRGDFVRNETLSFSCTQNVDNWTSLCSRSRAFIMFQ